MHWVIFSAEQPVSYTHSQDIGTVRVYPTAIVLLVGLITVYPV